MVFGLTNHKANASINLIFDQNSENKLYLLSTGISVAWDGF